MPDSPETRIRLLEEQAAEARAERRAFDRQFATFGPLATQILEAINDLRHLTQDFEDLKRDNNEDHRKVEQKVDACAHRVGQLDAALQRLTEEYEEDAAGRAAERKNLRDARRNFGVAMIGSLGVVIAALITAIATILGAQ